MAPRKVSARAQSRIPKSENRPPSKLTARYLERLSRPALRQQLIHTRRTLGIPEFADRAGYHEGSIRRWIANGISPRTRAHVELALLRSRKPREIPPPPPPSGLADVVSAVHLAFAVGAEPVRSVIPKTAKQFDIIAQSVADESRSRGDPLISKRINSIREAALEEYQFNKDEASGTAFTYRRRFLDAGISTRGLSDAWIREARWVMENANENQGEIIDHASVVELLEEFYEDRGAPGTWHSNDNGSMYDMIIGYVNEIPQGDRDGLAYWLITYEDEYDAVYAVRIWVLKPEKKEKSKRISKKS